MYCVFVYGTLKRGFHNNSLLEGSTSIGPAISIDWYYLADAGVPFAHLDEHGLPVYGELYDVDDLTLEQLDCLEGHPSWYKREERMFRLNGEKTDLHRAWIYEMPIDVSEYEEANKMEMYGEEVWCYGVV